MNHGQQAFGGWEAPLKTKIIKSCTVDKSNAWYKDMIGQEIKVRSYGTFGCWDEQERWISFYDLEFKPNE